VARGYPDFSGATAFPVRKHFRSPVPLVAWVNAGLTETEYLISDQAVIDGGFLYIRFIDDMNLISIILMIDGVMVGSSNLSNLLVQRRGDKASFPYTLLELDPDAQTAVIGFLADYYCGYQYQVQIVNAGANNLNVLGHLCYSDVQ
jgi:hypothetical protein